MLQKEKQLALHGFSSLALGYGPYHTFKPKKSFKVVSYPIENPRWILFKSRKNP
jgi:hypothetical protein